MRYFLSSVILILFERITIYMQLFVYYKSSLKNNVQLNEIYYSIKEQFVNISIGLIIFQLLKDLIYYRIFLRARSHSLSLSLMNMSETSARAFAANYQQNS